MRCLESAHMKQYGNRHIVKSMRNSVQKAFAQEAGVNPQEKLLVTITLRKGEDISKGMEFSIVGRDISHTPRFVGIASKNKK